MSVGQEFKPGDIVVATSGASPEKAQQLLAAVAGMGLRHAVVGQPVVDPVSLSKGFNHLTDEVNAWQLEHGPNVKESYVETVVGTTLDSPRVVLTRGTMRAALEDMFGADRSTVVSSGLLYGKVSVAIGALRINRAYLQEGTVAMPYIERNGWRSRQLSRWAITPAALYGLMRESRIPAPRDYYGWDVFGPTTKVRIGQLLAQIIGEPIPPSLAMSKSDWLGNQRGIQVGGGRETPTIGV